MPRPASVGATTGQRDAVVGSVQRCVRKVTACIENTCEITCALHDGDDTRQQNVQVYIYIYIYFDLDILFSTFPLSSYPSRSSQSLARDEKSQFANGVTNPNVLVLVRSRWKHYPQTEDFISACALIHRCAPSCELLTPRDAINMGSKLFEVVRNM